MEKVEWRSVGWTVDDGGSRWEGTDWNGFRPMSEREEEEGLV